MRIDRDYFEKLLGAELLSADYLTQGQIGAIYTLRTSSNRYLLKTSNPSNRLRIEAKMLGDIKKYGIASAEVFDVSDTHLLMEYVEEVPLPETKRELAAAEVLAALHSVTNDAHMYGYWYDTTIGPFEQKNEQTQYHWALFYAQMRLLPMVRICYDKGVLPQEKVEKIERLCKTLYTRIDMRKITPSLIHGDLWSGNILFNMSGAVLIDPALSFADREMELAFIKMFNTFGEPFFDAYTRHHPLSEDFETTKVPLYQLYYYLVHMALYGDAYLPGLDTALKRLKV